MKKIRKVVLAYSGGLDTSVILKWLQEQYGCEVVTFTPTSRRTSCFSAYTRGEEARKRFLIPLWNVYSFLATYARLDGWEPTHPFDPAVPEGPTPHSDNLLDRWILARLNQVVRRVTETLENSDTLSATIALEALLEDLSNWYVRRSRRRFWKSEGDADKQAAYSTLYEVLVNLAKSLAPVLPFMTEAVYQNLVRSVDASAPESIHH